jgi:hypothetical protein
MPIGWQEIGMIGMVAGRQASRNQGSMQLEPYDALTLRNAAMMQEAPGINIVSTNSGFLKSDKMLFVYLLNMLSGKEVLCKV